jgi:tetratricopeptide (TPR) repeat protein
MGEPMSQGWIRVTLILILFHASTALASVSGNMPDDPAADAHQKLTWIDVTPAPIPRDLPLLPVRRAPTAGTQVPAVDRAALRSLLVNRQFKQLTAVIERFQAAFEKDPSREEWMHDAYDVLGYAEARERELIEKWISATPRSFAPYLARAAYWVNTGFLWRGQKFYSETKPFEREAMQDAFDHARADLRKALALRPRLIEARIQLIQVEVAGGDRDVAERALEESLALCPSCYHVRVQWLWALQPRWGGSLEEMDAFVAERSDPASRRHRNLVGFVLRERARVLSLESPKSSEIRSLKERECAVGGEWVFLVACADQRKKEDRDGFLADLSRAEAVAPGLSEVLARRASAYVDAQRWEEAARDLLVVLRSRPVSNLGVRLHPRVLRALDTLAWKAHQAGQGGTAARLYELAVALAPGDGDLAGRAAVARRAAGPGSSRKAVAAVPVSGDARPDVRVTVEDGAGKPVSGARVVVEVWRSGADLPRGMVEAAGTSPIRADALGRAVAPVPVGRCLVMAFLPGEPLVGVVASVSVATTGADVRLVIRGTQRVQGRVTDEAPEGARQALAGIDVILVPSAEVEAGAPRGLGAARSGADGAFTVEGVDEGRYQVFAHGKGPRGAMNVTTQVEGGRSNLWLPLQEEKVLRGRVLVPGPDGPEPATRFKVLGPLFGRREFSAPDGRFSVEFAAGTAKWPYVIAAEGRPPVVRVLALEQPDTDLGDVVLGEGRIIRGRVVDPAGAPVHNARVGVAGQGYFLAWTQLDGSFEVQLGDDGPLPLQVQHDRWIRAEKEVAAGQTDVEVRMAAGARLRILVPDGNGAPVSGVSMVMLSRIGRAHRCFTGANGRCELSGLSPGEYTLLCQGRPQIDPTALAPAAMEVTVPGAEAELAVRFPWVRGQTRLTVNVAGDAAPATFRARVFPGSPKLAEVVDADGVARAPYYSVIAGKPLEGLPPGSYTVVVAQRSAFRVCAMRPIELRAGSDEAISITPADGGCR